MQVCFDRTTAAATGAKMSMESTLQSQTKAGPLDVLPACLASRFQVAWKKPAARIKARAKSVMTEVLLCGRCSAVALVRRFYDSVTQKHSFRPSSLPI